MEQTTKKEDVQTALTIQNKPLPKKAKEIEALVDQSEWEVARKETGQIEGLYKGNKWKYQLLGNDTEYNSLEQHIRKLMVSVEEEDKEEAKLNLEMIDHYMKSLYFK